MPLDADIALALDSVRRRLAAAAHRVQRPAASITLVAISKTFGPEHVRAAAAHGQRVFGENRVQEASGKVEALADLPLEWHLVGHLQSNKARKAVSTFACIQSVDRHDLVTKLDRAARDLGVRRRVLIQVDLAHEATKHGAAEGTLRDLVHAAADARALDLTGLMLVPPIPGTPEDSRPWFRQLRALRDELIHTGVPAAKLHDLSMGMSDDFEVAVEEGATIVRVGSSVFGRRPVPA